MKKVGAFEVLKKEQAVADLYGAIQRAVAAIQPVLNTEETLTLKQSASDAERAEEPSQTKPLPIEEPAKKAKRLIEVIGP